MNTQSIPALAVMLITQALVVMAAFTAPVLGKRFTDSIGLPPELIGYYTSVVFAGAMLASLLSTPLIQRHGSVRVSQATLVLAAAGLVMLVFGAVAAAALSAILLGFAYGPGNPASSQLLARTTPPHRRSMVFSLKQTAVPIGVTTAGVVLPYVTFVFGLEAALWLAAGTCLALAVAVQPWRGSLDKHRPERVGRASLAGPFRLVFSKPALRRLALVSGCLASVQFSFSAIFVTFLQQQTGASATEAGPILSIAMSISVALRVVLGAVADRFSGRAVLITMALFMVAPAAVLAGLPDAPFAMVALMGLILGSASFSWNGVYLAEVAEAAPADQVATATAGTMFFVFLGGFVGPGAVSTATALAGSYSAGFITMAAFAAAGTAALLLRPAGVRLKGETPMPRDRS